jgi:hypothetical protein
MESVLTLAARHAQCSLAAGLKIEPAALSRLARIWPALAATPGVTEAGCSTPRRSGSSSTRPGSRTPSNRYSTSTPAPSPTFSARQTRTASTAVACADPGNSARHRSASAAPPRWIFPDPAQATISSSSSMMLMAASWAALSALSVSRPAAATASLLLVSSEAPEQALGPLHLNV